MDCLPLPGSTFPLSLIAHVPKLNLLRASANCPPLISIRCLQQCQVEPHRVHDALMLCAVRNLALNLAACHMTQVEKISQHRPHAVLHAILRVICPCDPVDSPESLKEDCQGRVQKSCVRARDFSSNIFNAKHVLSKALQFSVSVEMVRPGCCIRSLGCSVMNEQLIALCNLQGRLDSAANRARQVFGHVPILSSDPLSAIWQLLSLCCLSPQDRIEALAPSASIFNLFALLRHRLETSKLFCR